MAVGLHHWEQLLAKVKCKRKRQKYHFSPYILGLQSIWSLHFSSQFGLCYFQFVVNLVPTVNVLMKNIYVTNSLPC